MTTLNENINYGQMVLDSVDQLNGAKKISATYIQTEAKENFGEEFNQKEMEELTRLFQEQDIKVIL